MLNRLGLTKYEKELISALVKLDYGTVNYRDAMHLAHIPYGKVHAVMNSLKEKGFLEETGGRPKEYRLRHIGDVIEDYIVKPLIFDLYGYPRDENTFQDIWVKEICSSIPVIRVNQDGAEEPIEMLSGLEEIRKAEIREIENAKEEVLMCFPRGYFLDRKFSDYVNTGSKVSMEVITPFTPMELMGHTFQAQSRKVRKMLNNDASKLRLHYFLNRNVKDRFIVVDGNFAAVGSELSPVLTHIYSKEHCSALKERFLEIRKYSKEINLWPA